MRFSSYTLMCLSLGAVMLSNNVVYADEEAADVEVSEEENVEKPTDDAYEYEDEDVAADVVTSYLLPDYADKQLPVGKPVTFLVNFINNGQEVLNITEVGGFLHSPFDHNYYIQNFTVKEVQSGMAAPISQISLEYQFTPDPTLEPLEFWMTAYVDFVAEGSDTVYRKVFFNETATLTNKDASIDFRVLGSSLVLLGAFCFGIYTLVGSTKQGAKAKKKFAGGKKPEPVDQAAVAASWDVAAYKPAEKARTAGNKKRAPKKN